jgi:PhzF family phenazine biosynthesis protein
MTSFPLYIVDAFADRPFAGNPAAVCILPEWQPDDLLRAIASELNLSETAFLVGANGVYQIRWFTPTREVDLIGHATLAAAHVVFRELEKNLHRVHFQSGSESIVVDMLEGSLAMDFPALFCEPVSDIHAISRALRATPTTVLAGKHYVAVFETADEIRRLTVDMLAVARLDLPAVVVTAPADEPGIDFVSRFFAPANGVPEDPVSGVAHLVLVPFWSQQLGRKRLIGRQLSRRGGVVVGEDRGSRVCLMGASILILAGQIYPESMVATTISGSDADRRRRLQEAPCARP